MEQLFHFWNFLHLFIWHLTIHTLSPQQLRTEKTFNHFQQIGIVTFEGIFVVKLVEIGHGYRMNPAWEECSAALVSHETFFLSLFGTSEHLPGVGIWIRLCFSTLTVVCSRVSYHLPHWDLLIHFPSSWHKWKGIFFWLFSYKAALCHGRGTVWNLSRDSREWHLGFVTAKFHLVPQWEGLGQ